MNIFLRSCLLTIGIVTGTGQLLAQESPERIAAIMRDMETRVMGAGQSVSPPPSVAVVQVAAVQPATQSVVEEQAMGIPGYLLPEVYSSDPSIMNPLAGSYRELQQLPLGERFMFSSAYQRRINPPRGSFANVPDDCGCCDEWQTFMPCESCCRDLGLNPWVVGRARPNCPPDYWTHPGRSGQCADCQSGSGWGANGYARPSSWYPRSNW